MNILPIGGRIKSASVGLDHLYGGDVVEVDRAIAHLRREPFAEMRTAFFPRTGAELKQHLRGVGFYRPSLKTDQGMPGNFLPFSIDPTLLQTDMSVRSISREEGVAIEEAWHDTMNGVALKLQQAFLGLDLKATFGHLQDLEGRRAEKGRMPFFLIRPALSEHDIVLGQDTVARAQSAIDRTLERYVRIAHEREQGLTGGIKPLNLPYFQPDVFILRDGTAEVERFNCPDVGFFLARISVEGASILPRVSSIVRRLLDAVAARIVAAMGEDITIVTRDEVFSKKEDILELHETSVLAEALRALGARVRLATVSDTGSFENGARLLLLNLDYRSEGAETLLRRHGRGEVECFPNPFFQQVCQESTGLKETVLDPESKYGRIFLNLARSQPTHDEGTRDVLRRIDQALTKTGMENDIIHAVLRSETVPVFRKSLHAWRQLAARAQRQENAGIIRFRGIPATPDNLLLTSTTGPRLHAFRFMCVS